MSEPTKGAETTPDWIVLKPEARNKASDYMKKEGREAVRVAFDPSGALGLELDRVREGDRTFKQGDVTVAVPEAAVEYVKGLVVDFETKDGASGFSFSGTAPALDKTVALKARAAIEASEKGPPILSLGEFLRDQFTSTYGKVAGILTLFTVLELLAIKLPASKQAIIAVLVILACWKAALVGMYFMHLRFEGRWKNVVLIPPVILAFVLVFALYPDVGAYDRLPYFQKVPASAVEGAAEAAHEKHEGGEKK